VLNGKVHIVFAAGLCCSLQTLPRLSHKFGGLGPCVRYCPYTNLSTFVFWMDKMNWDRIIVML